MIRFCFRYLSSTLLVSAITACGDDLSLGGQPPSHDDGDASIQSDASLTTLHADDASTSPSDASDAGATDAGAVVVLVQNPGQTPRGIAVDSQYIFWAAQQSGGADCSSSAAGARIATPSCERTSTGRT